jgi:hypothetical protein
VGVGAVGVGADVGAVLPDQAFAAHGFAEPLHHVEFGEARRCCRRWGAGAGHLAPGLGEDGVDGLLRDAVAGDLLRGQDRFKLADEVGGADDLLAEAAQEFDGAGVDHGDVHDGVVGGVLHGDAARAGEHGFEAGGKLLPA